MTCPAVSAWDMYMLCILVLLGGFVITKMIVRDWQRNWEPCDPSTILSKHEFCVNA